MKSSELINRIYHSWTDLRMFIDGLSEPQLTVPTDAAGWTVKDHLIHLAVWEDTVDGLLNGQPVWKRMGIELETWRTIDVDTINAIIQQRDKDKPLSEVLNTLTAIHQRVVAQIHPLTAEDLQKQANVEHDAWKDYTYRDWLIWNTYEHYDEHLLWMDRIAYPRTG